MRSIQKRLDALAAVLALASRPAEAPQSDPWFAGKEAAYMGKGGGYVRQVKEHRARLLRLHDLAVIQGELGVARSLLLDLERLDRLAVKK